MPLVRRPGNYSERLRAAFTLKQNTKPKELFSSLCVFVCVRLCMAHMQRSEGNVQESVFSFHCMGPKDQTQVVSLVTSAFNLPSHLVCLQASEFFNPQMPRPPCLSPPSGFKKWDCHFIFREWGREEPAWRPHPDRLLCTRHAGKRNATSLPLYRFPRSSQVTK